MRSQFGFGVVTIAVVAVLGTGASSAPESVQLPPFSGIQVRNGGHIAVRYGTTQRVTVVEGSRDYIDMSVNESGILVIDECRAGCPRHYRAEIEVVAPKLTRISLANGGRIQVRGTFPRQQDLIASVMHGGTVDVRSMVVESVNASVQQGGRILTIPRATLLARVSNGGVITWWGNPRVDSSTDHGGVIQKGEPDEIDLPLSEAGNSFPVPVRKH